MTDVCLCGKAHPCPDHGPHIGPYQPAYRTHAQRRDDPFNGFLLLRLLDQADGRGRRHQPDQKEAS